MKKLIYVVLTVLIVACSSDDSDSNQNGSVTDAKELVKVVLEGFNGLPYNLLFHYENGKVSKILDENHQWKHQIVYNSEGKVSRIYTEWISQNQDNENFEWDIIDTAVYSENVYENGKLVAIINDYGTPYENLTSFIYEGDLLVQEKDKYRTRNYEYNSDDEMTHYILDERDNGGSIHMMLVEFDNKVNPFYKLWNESKLKLPTESSYDHANFLSFYPNNFIRQVGANDNEVDVIRIYNYDGDDNPISLNQENIQGEYNYSTNFFFEYN